MATKLHTYAPEHRAIFNRKIGDIFPGEPLKNERTGMLLFGTAVAVSITPAGVPYFTGSAEAKKDSPLFGTGCRKN